ncbi:glycosyltransferase [Vibrio vulnificus]|nr:glycosyltransferase [Vibrio vulnificus]
MKLMGVVVLYNPDRDVIYNIETYIDHVEKLFVVDNSDNKKHQYQRDIQELSDKIELIQLGENLGIATALNLGVNRCIENGASHALTMDQDSKFEKHGFYNYVKKIEQDLEISQVGIYCTSVKYSNVVEYPKVAITSGNIISLESYQRVGGFEDKLFIDAVDYVYSFAVRTTGFKIKKFGDILLIHKLGEPKIVKFFNGKTLKFNTHSAVRRYYMTRNSLYFWKKYFWNDPVFMSKKMFMFSRNLLEIIAVSDNKAENIKHLIKGVYHFMIGKYGKLEV